VHWIDRSDGNDPLRPGVPICYALIARIQPANMQVQHTASVARAPLNGTPLASPRERSDCVAHERLLGA